MPPNTMTLAPPDPPLRVAILALPDSAPLAIHGLFEVLGSAGRLWTTLTGQPSNSRRIDVRIVGRVAAPFRSAVGVPISPDWSLEEVPQMDVIIVADVELPLAREPADQWGSEITWLLGRAGSTPLICSTCSGSLVLAEAGLLDGRDAASHWSAAAVFADRYPKVRYRPERILCDSGLDGRLITSGGASSWQDLALYLIGRFCGPEEAVRTAKIFLIGDRSDGQLPFAAMIRPRTPPDAIIAEVQAWVAEHYRAGNPVSAMIARSGLAARTFKRRFTLATGYTPVAYVQALRIEEAKQMLEVGDEPVETVATEVGYEDASFFRRLFKRQVGVTPAAYRQRIRPPAGLPKMLD